jgi:hypothetical protein
LTNIDKNNEPIVLEKTNEEFEPPRPPVVPLPRQEEQEAV